MKTPRIRKPLALTLMVLFAVFAPGIARAQYTETGHTAGGGNIIVGNGALGALSNSTSPALSAGGFDSVTLNIGSIATASGQDTIAFVTSNDTLLNNGTVIGANNSGGSGYNGISFNAVSLSNETVTNNGTITAGNGVGPTNRGGWGIAILSLGGPVSNVTVTNNGSVAGGNSNASGNSYGGIGIAIIAYNSGGSMNNVTVTNNGSVTGGYDTGSGAGGNDAIAINSYDNMSGITVTNNGSVTGGSGNGGNGGDAIDITTELGNASALTVTNNGSLIGGNDTGGATGGNGINIAPDGNVSNVVLTNNGSVTGGNGSGGGGGSGIVMQPDGSLSTVTLTNNGSITGGGDSGGSNGGAGIQVISGGNVSGVTLNNAGSISGGGGSGGGGGAGILIQAEDDNVSGVALTNNGSIAGGNDSGGSNGGPGVEVVAFENLSGLTLTNNSSISGGGSSFGSGGPGITVLSDEATVSNVTVNNTGSVTGGNGGGEGGGNGVFIQSLAGNLSNDTVNNTGTITGGNDTSGAGSGISFSTPGGGNSNLVVTNFGTITGGNGLSGGAAGNGISSNAGNLTINNWGAISTGAGTDPAAINLQISSNNVVNLNGHSSVNGLITADGTPNSNILNLNFTGLSPSAIAALKAQLVAEGVPVNAGIQSSSGTFTVRGVTYTYDPLVVNLNVSSYQLQGLTPNQQAIGANLDSLTYNPTPGSSFFNLLNAIDLSGNVPLSLEELSPQEYEAYGDLAIENATATTQEIDARLNNLRDGSESIDTTEAGGATDKTTSGYSKESDGKDAKNIEPPAPAPEKRWGFFATGDGLFFRGDSHNVDLQDGKSNTAGTLAGVDGKVGEQGVIGAFFAYDNADATLGNDGSHATIESYSGGLYGSWHNDGFFVNGLASYTRNDYSSDRNILLPGYSTTAAGGTHGNQYTGNIDGGYDWHVTDRVTAGPLLGLQYTHLDVNSFDETGGGVGDLAVGSESMNSLQSRLGGRIDYHLLTGPNASFAAEAHAAWQHEFLDDSRAIGASFEGTGLSPFSIQTSAPLRDAAVVGIGVNFTFHNRLTLFADYELQLWQSSYIEQTINGGGRISF